MTSNLTATPAADRSPWFASWFDSAHYHRLYADRNDAEAAGFIDTLLGRLQPPARARLLDLGCGAGRHSKYLAAKGFRVTGIDLAASSIAQARRFERPGLRFLRQDMRVPFGRQAYDYVFSFFTSFGYFDSPAEHLTVVGNIARSLTTNGLLVLDYLNARQAERRLTPEDLRFIDGVRYLITRWTDDCHFFKRISVEGSEQRPIEHVERVAKFRLQEFDWMFSRHGLRIEQVYGDYRLSPFDANTSPRLILVARKVAHDVFGDARLKPRAPFSAAYGARGFSRAAHAYDNRAGSSLGDRNCMTASAIK